MNTFVDAISEQEARTLNGMKARETTANACVDLFFKIGASRGKDIIPQFVSAFVENPDYALRIAQWTRDIREGAGERQLFKDILIYLDKAYPGQARHLINKVELLGRWDDLLIKYTDTANENYAFSCIAKALSEGNQLCAKWLPRKGPFAIKLRTFLGLSPKKYRKYIVGLTNVVETKMCKKEWDDINYSHVPSLAASRYRTAFYRNSEERFTEYVDKLSSGDKTVKVNAGAVYPYDVLKSLFSDYGYTTLNKTDINFIIAQWDALENFIGDANIFPMIDTSGSMYCPAGNSKSITCMNVAISLGLYIADKNKGVFKDTFLTFSGDPKIQKVHGNIVEKSIQTSKAHWGMNTNLHKAFGATLNMATQNNVPAEDMPEMLLILSDMQFDYCVDYDNNAMEMIERKYKESGYEVPKIVFWNMNSYDSCPVKYNEQNVCLVSGFSPSIMKAVLNANFEEFTPLAIMKQTILNERYDF